MGVMLIAIGVLMWLAERGGREARDLASARPGATRWPSALAQALAVVPGCSRSGITISRRAVPQSGPRGGRAFFLPALHAGHRRRGRQDALGHAQTALAARPLTTQFRRRRGGERGDRLRRHRLVSALFASQRFASVRVLPHYFWHNSACSGFHPPASVMKLLSPTQHKRLNEVTASCSCRWAW